MQRVNEMKSNYFFIPSELNAKEKRTVPDHMVSLLNLMLVNRDSNENIPLAFSHFRRQKKLLDLQIL